MKKRILSALVVIALIASTAPALAKDSDDSPSEHRSFRQRVLDVFQRNAERHEQRREQLAERRRQQLENWWERTESRLERLIGHLERIANLIQDRIDRLTDAGRDTAELQERMDEAYVKIDAARTRLASASVQVEDILSSDESPTAIFRELRALHRDVLNEFKVAHRALIRVLAATRGLSVTPTPTSTPTPTESESPTPTPTESESPTPTPTESESPTPTPTESESPTPTPTESESPTPTPSS